MQALILRPVLWCAVALSAVRFGEALSKPNIIVFTPDDLPFIFDEAPAGGNLRSEFIPTPHMDRIRSEGAVFTRAYASSPMCAPSRFSALTGRYASRSVNAQAASASNPRQSPDSTVTRVTVPACKIEEGDKVDNLPTALKNRGYATAIAGKYHLMASEGQGEWDQPYSDVQAHAQSVGFTHVDSVYAGNFASTEPFSHNMEWLVDGALKAVEDAKQQDKPLFLYFAPTISHTPSVVDALIAGSPQDTPAGRLPSPLSSPLPSRESVLSRARVAVAAMEAQGIAVSDRDVDGVAAAVWCDDALGALINSVDMENTMVVVTMDHGVLGKGSLDEGGLRIMQFARFPPLITAGTTDDRVVSNVDLAPSLLFLADSSGVTVHVPTGNLKASDGVSWLPMGATYAEGSESVFGEINDSRTVITRDFKLVVNGEAGDGPM